MHWIREKILDRQLLAGTFLGLGSSVTAEITAHTGFDWILIDLEHGVGDRPQLVQQLQAIRGGTAAPLVRIQWNETPTFKRILDLGPSGVMIPFVNNAAEAEHAVESMLYPPDGVRGVAILTRASGFGQQFDQYFEEANKNLAVVAQIESVEGLKNAEAIAAVDRVDVLFIGPMDLSVSMGIPKQFDHPDFKAALAQVVGAAKNAGKAAGILAGSTAQLEGFIEAGFSFVACGSDASAVTAGMNNVMSAFERFRS